MDQQTRKALLDEHRPEAIRARLAESRHGGYLPDLLLGGIDGCVTTVAVVAGALGAGISGTVALILGLANIVADGFSMAVSNYQSTKAQQDLIERSRRTEELHIAQFPEGEREEIRQIFQRKGFKGETLQRIVETITSNRQLWIETMLTEELGLQRSVLRPMRSALATFAAFVLVGVVPLLPLAAGWLTTKAQTALAMSLAAAAFFAIGLAKGRVLQNGAWRSGAETLLTGGTAAALAFAVGYGLRQAFGLG
jgi:VIT1/CCC1 family predicted Fe2+/Mn2+ transporter